MFVDCITEWHAATGAWPTVTKDKETGDALHPLYRELDVLLRELGADEAHLRGTGATMFVEAVQIAKGSGGLGPLSLLGGRHMRKLERAHKRKAKRVAERAPAKAKPTNRKPRA